MKFVKTSFGPGSFVRFKSVSSHRWEYGIYRGTSQHNGRVVAYEFSETPLGPVTRWLHYWPEFMECAVTERGALVDYRPEISTSLSDHEHEPVQHRDGKPAWCRHCGLTAEGSEPVSRIRMTTESQTGDDQ